MKTAVTRITLLSLAAVVLEVALPRVASAAETASPATASPSSGMITGRVKNAATSQYLVNSRVTVKGTNLEVFTDATGMYRLVNVPRGPVVLEVFYTGLDPKQVTLEVGGDGAIEQDVELSSAARYGTGNGVINLDAVQVAAGKLVEGDALAVNEQRFAPNIKSVVATDMFGDLMGDNLGEFLKLMPGMTTGYNGNDVTGVSMRGFPGNYTNYMEDGAGTTTSHSSSVRSAYVLGMTVTSASRIEVTKVPTPAMPADSIAGSINLISKSAFERSGAELKYGVQLHGSNYHFGFEKEGTRIDEDRHWFHPGFNFDYTLPINKNLGVVVTGMFADKISLNRTVTTTYNAGGTSTGASFSKPYLQSVNLLDGARPLKRRSGGIKVDWRITPNGVLSLGFETTDFLNYNQNPNVVANVGTVGTPNPATLANAVSFSSGDDFVIGASGRGAYTQSYNLAKIFGYNVTNKANYRFDDGRWKVEAGLSATKSERSMPTATEGIFGILTLAMRNPVRVTFRDITKDGPGTIQVFDNTNREVDVHNIDNWVLNSNGTNARQNRAEFQTAKLDVRRRVNLLPFPAAFQVGGRQTVQVRDATFTNITRTFNGPDGNPATVDSLVPYLADHYHYDSGIGVKDIPMLSERKLFAAWQANPNLFTATPAQFVAAERVRINASEHFTERVSGLYAQAEAHLMNNRLLLLTGVRYEKTVGEGVGPLSDPGAAFQRAANGTFLRDASGARIRRPEAGAAGSIEELRLTLHERANRGRKGYDGYYPSLHATYNLRENLLLRGAYAKTYGRPDFANIIPNTTINESDLTGEQLAAPNVSPGTILVRNTGLQPWKADNYDLSLEHYSASGGVISVGVFLKRITDFFGNEVFTATAADAARLGLGPEYVGWRVSTQINAGNAQMAGGEFNFRQPLRQLGSWGRYFVVFVNATKLKARGERQAEFNGLVPTTCNWGVAFSRKRFSASANWQYIAESPGDELPDVGSDGRAYDASRTALDLSFGYQITRRLRVVASINNVFDAPQVFLRYATETPGYARQNLSRTAGVVMAIGLKGTF